MPATRIARPAKSAILMPPPAEAPLAERQPQAGGVQQWAGRLA